MAAPPPHFQLCDGKIALGELHEVIEDLERIGASSEGELVLYAGKDVLQSDLPSLASGTILATDTDAVIRFVADDLSGLNLRAIVDDQNTVRIVTDLATYRVKL